MMWRVQLIVACACLVAVQSQRQGEHTGSGKSRPAKYGEFRAPLCRVVTSAGQVLYHERCDFGSNATDQPGLLECRPHRPHRNHPGHFEDSPSDDEEGRRFSSDIQRSRRRRNVDETSMKRGDRRGGERQPPPGAGHRGPRTQGHDGGARRGTPQRPEPGQHDHSAGKPHRGPHGDHRRPDERPHGRPEGHHGKPGRDGRPGGKGQASPMMFTCQPKECHGDEDCSGDAMCLRGTCEVPEEYRLYAAACLVEKQSEVLKNRTCPGRLVCGGGPGRNISIHGEHLTAYACHPGMVHRPDTRLDRDSTVSDDTWQRQQHHHDEDSFADMNYWSSYQRDQGEILDDGYQWTGNRRLLQEPHTGLHTERSRFEGREMFEHGQMLAREDRSELPPNGRMGQGHVHPESLENRRMGPREHGRMMGDEGDIGPELHRMGPPSHHSTMPDHGGKRDSEEGHHNHGRMGPVGEAGHDPLRPETRRGLEHDHEHAAWRPGKERAEPFERERVGPHPYDGMPRDHVHMGANEHGRIRPGEQESSWNMETKEGDSTLWWREQGGMVNGDEPPVMSSGKHQGLVERLQNLKRDVRDPMETSRSVPRWELAQLPPQMTHTTQKLDGRGPLRGGRRDNRRLDLSMTSTRFSRATAQHGGQRRAGVRRARMALEALRSRREVRPTGK